MVSINAFVSPDDALGFGSPIRAKVLDLSRAGAKLHAKELLLPGGRYTVALNPESGDRRQLDARVVWVEHSPLGGFAAGVAFRNLSPDDEYLVDLALLRGAH